MKAQQETRPVFSVLLALFVLFVLFRAYAYSQEDKVRTAVVRYLTESTRAGTIFVSIDGSDANSSFIGQFRNSKVLVRKGSEAIARSSGPYTSGNTYYLDPETGRSGYVMDMSKPSWIGPLWAHVDVDTPGVGMKYTVVLTPGGWAVTKDEMTWIQ